jgi:hypothetical protein
MGTKFGGYGGLHRSRVRRRVGFVAVQVVLNAMVEFYLVLSCLALDVPSVSLVSSTTTTTARKRC